MTWAVRDRWQAAESRTLATPSGALATPMDLEQTQAELLAALTTALNLTGRVRWVRIRARLSHTVLYADGTAVIKLGTNPSPLSPEALCCHEMAHVLAEQRYRHNGHRHGHHFTQALVDVIAAAAPLWRGPYPWFVEYPTVRRIWLRHFQGRPSVRDAVTPHSGWRAV